MKNKSKDTILFVFCNSDVLTKISNFAVGWTTKKCDRDATDLPTKLIPIACPTCVTLIGFTPDSSILTFNLYCSQDWFTCYTGISWHT